MSQNRRLRMPGFTAEASLASTIDIRRAKIARKKRASSGEVVLLQMNGEPWEDPWGGEVPWDPEPDWDFPGWEKFLKKPPPSEPPWGWGPEGPVWEPPPPPTGPGFFGWPGWGAIGATAAATLVGIGLGTLAGYEIEEKGLLAPKWPPPATPTPSCVAVPPNTQHSITSSSHLGCARSESLARRAADDDCKTRTTRCTGTCPGSAACTPYARVWNTATIPAGGIFDALWNGCSTTAYYTCECGC